MDHALGVKRSRFENIAAPENISPTTDQVLAAIQLMKASFPTSAIDSNTQSMIDSPSKRLLAPAQVEKRKAEELLPSFEEALNAPRFSSVAEAVAHFNRVKLMQNAVDVLFKSDEN